ncbi:stalk domain-containing protein [Moorella sp. Hama-1]|uniref:stalk domain-containing protein n=1 Tax=Moorella sp. Hama-1 TaxID=2138101 RepID=UPI000D641E07|nr:stalk domain-containing protein [Moorella sp. Hama-1]BCV20389.1 hypothetical protein hamaS1_04580 [Moorella sp. Hama-1]
MKDLGLNWMLYSSKKEKKGNLYMSYKIVFMALCLIYLICFPAPLVYGETQRSYINYYGKVIDVKPHGFTIKVDKIEPIVDEPYINGSSITKLLKLTKDEVKLIGQNLTLDINQYTYVTIGDEHVSPPYGIPLDKAKAIDLTKYLYPNDYIFVTAKDKNAWNLKVNSPMLKANPETSNTIPSNLRDGALRAIFRMGQEEYTIDGRSYPMNAVPFMENNRAYIPVRYLAYVIGINGDMITYDNGSIIITHFVKKTGSEIYPINDRFKGTDSYYRRLTIKEGSKVLTIEDFGPAYAGISNFEVIMDVAPIIREGRAYLPARYIAQALGYETQWDEKNQDMTIWNSGEVE